MATVETSRSASTKASKKADVLASLRKQISSIESATASTDKSSSEDSEAFSRLVKLVAHRDRSCCEIRTRLTKEDFTSEDIERAIQRACACNLINDGRFADARIRFLINKGKGISAIEQDLEKHNIALCDVSGWPYEYLDTSAKSEINRAVQLLERKPSKSKNQLLGNYNKLIREGYSSYVANRAVDKFIQQHV